MIVESTPIIKQSLDTISEAKDRFYCRVLPTGELEINNYFKSYVYLAYVRGKWFASYGTRRSASESIPAEGVPLFVYGDGSLLVQNNTKQFEISNSLFPLDKNTHLLLFAFYGTSYSLIIADGSKYAIPIATTLKKKPENVALALLSLTAMIRQYDEKAADAIEQFWFRKTASDNSNTSESVYDDQTSA